MAYMDPEQKAALAARKAEAERKLFVTIARWVVSVVLGLGLLVGVGCPQYKVYKQTQDGKAKLAESEHSRQVAIEEAKANLAAEKLNAQAEVERAKGAAESIRIEGGKLTDQYIKYLWVRQQKPGAGQTIYIPTEAGLPVLEAGKR